MSRVLVVGAGIAGLACAHELRRRKRDVLVLEASGRAGGVIGPLEEDGFRFETGPNTVPRSARAFRRLCVELGLDELWLPTSPLARARYLWHAGALVPLPTGPLELARSPLLSRAAKLHLLSEPLRRAPRPGRAQGGKGGAQGGGSGNGAAREEDEPTLAAFLEERLGPEPTRRLAGAFVRGIYAAELERLGARSAFPRLYALVRDHGGLARGALAALLGPRLGRGPRRGPLPGPEVPRGRALSFPRGLATLTDALARSLGPALRTGAGVGALRRTAAGWSAVLEDGEELAGTALVLAVPAPAAARLLAGLDAEQGAPPGVVATLAAVEHAALTLVHLGFEDAELPQRPRGFGYLVPPPEAGAPMDGVDGVERVEPRMGRGSAALGGAPAPAVRAPRALGTIFVSDLFPQRAPAGCSATTSFYRTSDLGTSEHEPVVRLACEDLALACGAERAPRPRVALVHAWRDVIPQYAVGHARRLAAAERELAAALPGLLLAGSYVGGVSVEDRIAHGRAVAQAAAMGRAHEVQV